MEPDECFMSTPINPNNFPAKLWRLVNSPRYQSISWDSPGDGIIIDQQLFESELLCPLRGMNEATELFKTTNFTSFIRQLNLYGFRKLVLGSGSNTGHHVPGGDLGVGDGSLHHFYNDHFRKGRPELLVNLKRLTSTNKAKLAAGLEVNSRPPNRFQRLLTSSLTEDSKEDCQGLMTVEQIHRSCRRDNISPYPYLNPPSHNHIAFPGKQLECTPIPPRTWSNSFGLHQRPLATHPSFPEKGMFYPVLQRFPTDITYTMQSTATSVHVQQAHSAMPGSMPRYGGYMPHTAQYPQAFYPSAVLPCCTTPAHLHHLTGCPGPAVSSYQRCGYFQSPPMHPSFPMEFFHTNWPSSDSDEYRKDEMNLESVFQFADELQSSSQLEMVKLDTVEGLVEPAAAPLQKENAVLAMSPGNDESYCNQTKELESLLPVNADITTEALLADQPINCQSPAYDYPFDSDHTEDEVNASSESLCVDEVDLLVSDVTSSLSQTANHEYRSNTSGILKLEKSADLNLLVEAACKLGKKEELKE